MKRTIILMCGLLCAPLAAFAQGVSPSITYTPEQVRICEPRLLLASDGDAAKSATGQEIDVYATSVLRAGKGKMFDWRDGAIVATVGGLNILDRGKAVASKRANGFMVLEITLRSHAGRGQSLRAGRNAKIHNAIAAYEVNATSACADALGFFSL